MKRLCLREGCNALTSATYCPAHQRKQRDRHRLSRRERGYDADHHKARVAVLFRDGYRCAYCGQQAATADHLIPLSKGGTNDLENLVAACRSCNSRKGTRL